MIYGPPGTGKSTLARVLAKQVGYEVREISASEKRTGEQLIDEIKNAITTNAHFDKTGFLKIKPTKDQQISSRKPVCLILDELDGALGGGPDANKGLGQVADFLKRCLKESENAAKAKELSD